MKWIIICVTVFLLYASSFAAPKKSQSTTKRSTTITTTAAVQLANEFKDIWSILPKENMTRIFHEHLKTDEEFKAAIIYMQSDEWKNLIATIRKKPEWIKFKEFLKENVIDIDPIINCNTLNNVTVMLNTVDPEPKKSFKSFLLDIEKEVPVLKIMGIMHDKINKNDNFQKLLDKLSSNETHKMLDDLINLEEIKKILKIYAEMDLNLADLISLLYTFLGWGEFKL